MCIIPTNNTAPETAPDAVVYNGQAMIMRPEELFMEAVREKLYEKDRQTYSRVKELVDAWRNEQLTFGRCIQNIVFHIKCYRSLLIFLRRLLPPGIAIEFDKSENVLLFEGTKVMKFDKQRRSRSADFIQDRVKKFGLL